MRKARVVGLLVSLSYGMLALGAPARVGASESAAPAEWDALDGAGLVDLAKQLADQKEAGHETRVLLTGFLEAKYLKDPEAVRSLTCYEWRELAWYLRSDVSKEVRASWAEKLLKAFAGTREELLGLDGESFACLARAVAGHLGGGGVPALAATWLVADDSWKALSLFELDWLSCMAWKAGAVGDPARKRLVNHLTSAHFGDVATVRAAGVKCWHWFTFYLAGSMSDEIRTAWAGRLCEAFVGSPEAVAGLTGDDARRLESTLRSLCGSLPPEARRSWFVRIKAAFAQDEEALTNMASGEARSLLDSLSALDQRQAAELALRWFATRSDWRSAPAADLVALAYVAAEGDPKATAPLMDDLERAWIAADGKEPLDLSSIYRIMRVWSIVGDEEKARAWVMRAYVDRLGTEDGRNAIDVVSLGRLADFMREVGLTGEDKGYPGFAAALAMRARDGTLAEGLAKYAPRTYWAPCDPAVLALPLGTPEPRQTLRNELTDAQGLPRPDVAKVLGVAYQLGGERDTWVKAIEQRLADPNSDADTRARWLLVRASAEAALSMPPSPLCGRKWLEEALATATSTSLRVAALEELVNGYLFHRMHDEALTLLEDAGEGSLDPEAAQRIAVLRSSVEEAKARAILEEEQARAQAVALYREEVQRRLDAARAKGDAAAVRRYERLLGVKD